ncbi:MAG: nucleotidyltransferase domain-containing protein [Deltaproteobacteria bacterium]|nr:nucleotidyltransferase domain-containing protein [Deltaproteobacteria bacterium]
MLLKPLKTYFEKRDDVALAFLFGSAATGRVRMQGDIDIAVYFRPEHGVEWEVSGKRWEAEARIALDLERLLKKEIDLIVLNRARATLADEIIRKGTPLIIKDTGLLLDFLCIVSDEAEYVREWMLDYYKEAQIAQGR